MPHNFVEVEDVADFASVQEGEQTNPEIYYFTAPWCAPCKKLSPILEKVAKENPGFSFLKIDIERNDNAKIAEHYNVTSVPTLVLVQGGERISTMLGAQNERSVLRWLGLL